MWVSVGSLIWATVQFQPVRQNINLTTDLALTKEMREKRVKMIFIRMALSYKHDITHDTIYHNMARLWYKNDFPMI